MLSGFELYPRWVPLGNVGNSNQSGQSNGYELVEIQVQ